METLLQINIPIGMSRLADDSLTARTTPKDFGRWSKMIQSKIERPMFLWFANLSTKGPKTQRSIPFDHFALSPRNAWSCLATCAWALALLNWVPVCQVTSPVSAECVPGT